MAKKLSRDQLRRIIKEEVDWHDVSEAFEKMKASLADDWKYYIKVVDEIDELAQDIRHGRREQNQYANLYDDWSDEQIIRYSDALNRYVKEEERPEEECPYCHGTGMIKV